MGLTSAQARRYLAASAEYLFNLENTGASARTIHNYSSRLNNFYVHMIENGYSIQGPCFTAVQTWRDSLKAAGRSPSTIKQYLIELRMFFTWASDPELGEKRWYDNNPVAKSLIPDTSRADKRPYNLILTDEQVMLLWRNNPIVTTHPENWARNYAIVMLLLTTEIRNGEFLSLTPADLDFENSEITVEHGKGDKYRVVDFPLIAQTAVRMYLASPARPQSLSDDLPLFGTQANSKGHPDPSGKVIWKRGTQQWLSEVVARHVKAVTGVPDVRTHDLRHVGARLDLNSGMSMEALQSKLGHESIETTQVYCGKLASRRSRKRTGDVYAERDLQAARNAAALEGADDPFDAANAS